MPKRKMEKLPLTPYSSSLVSGDPQEFIDDFLHQMAYHQWDAFTAWCHLRSYVRGPAKAWLRKQPTPTTDLTTTSLHRLLDQFVSTMRGGNWRREQKLRLQAVRQTVGESVTDYAARFEAQYDVYNAACGGGLEIDNDIDEFINGFLPQLRQDIRVSGTVGFAAVISYARGRELEQPLIPNSSASQQTVNINALMPAGRPDQGGRERGDSNVENANIRCYQCQNYGHYARNCMLYERRRSRSPSYRRDDDRSDSRSPSSGDRSYQRDERDYHRGEREARRTETPLGEDEDARGRTRERRGELRSEVRSQRGREDDQQRGQRSSVTLATALQSGGTQGQQLPSRESSSSSENEWGNDLPPARRVTTSSRRGSRSVHYESRLPTYMVQLPSRAKPRRRSVTVAHLRTALRSPSRQPVPALPDRERPLGFSGTSPVTVALTRTGSSTAPREGGTPLSPPMATGDPIIMSRRGELCHSMEWSVGSATPVLLTREEKQSDTTYATRCRSHSPVRHTTVSQRGLAAAVMATLVPNQPAGDPSPPHLQDQLDRQRLLHELEELTPALDPLHPAADSLALDVSAIWNTDSEHQPTYAEFKCAAGPNNALYTEGELVPNMVLVDTGAAGSIVGARVAYEMG